MPSGNHVIGNDAKPTANAMQAYLNRKTLSPYLKQFVTEYFFIGRKTRYSLTKIV